MINKALYVRAAIAKVHLAKALFILEIEQFKEAYIPSELSQDKLPISFCFYDTILGFIQDETSWGEKNLTAQKNQFKLGFYK